MKLPLDALDYAALAWFFAIWIASDLPFGGRSQESVTSLLVIS